VSGKKLPAGWESGALRDLTAAQKGKLPKAFSDAESVGYLPYIDIKAFEKKQIERYAQLKGAVVADDSDVFVVWDGARFGLAGKGQRGVLGSTLVRIHSEAVSPDLLYYFIHSKYRQIQSKPRGTGTPHVEPEVFWSLELPVPPANEQERIASKIDELFSRIDEGERALERVQKLVERYRQSVLKAAVTGELTRAWREKNKDKLESGEDLLGRILKARREAWERDELQKMKAKGITPTNDMWKQGYREPQTPDTAGLSSLPRGWVWATVDQLSTKVVDGVHRKPHYVSAGIPFVTVKNLTAGPGISFEQLNYITPEDHAEFIKRTDPERGDVLVSKDGTLGVIRVVRTDTVFSIFVSVALVKPVKRDMAEYIGLSLSSPVVQAQMVPKGSGLQHIHLEDLRRDCIPLCGRDEQAAVVEAAERHLVSIEHFERDLAGRAKLSANLRQSILKVGFSGSLVDQDPDDEPAAAFLERIAAHRATCSAASIRGRNKKAAA
jgi:type I restriction enzyme, S subunit